jgi:hypothetical protein
MQDDDYIEVTNRDIKALQQHYWYQGDLEWKLDALQRRISAAVKSKPHAKKICILSSRQIGKSFWSVNHSLEYLIQQQTIARIVAPTLHNCHDIVNDNLAKITEHSPEGLIKKKRSEMRWEIENGSSLRLGALERAHVDDMNRGGNASLIIYEECGFVKGDDFLYGVNSVLGPQLLRSNGKEIFVSSPPEDPDHPLVTMIKPECEDLGTFFSFSVFDSPSVTPQAVVEAATRSGCKLTEAFILAVKEGMVNSGNVHEVADRTGSNLSDAFRREFLAEIIRPATYMVVPDFRDDITQVWEFDNPYACKWSVTVDWGGVRDMTVALLHTYDFMTNLDMIRDERVFPANTPTSRIVEELRRAWEGDYEIEARWADVHGQTQVDLTQLGYEVGIPQKSDWLGTVQAMAVKFTQNRIVIDPRCKFLRRSLKAGMFNKQRTDFERSQALGHCDALAALMYAVRSQDRTNPYVNRPSDRIVTVHKDDSPEMELANALNPKTFGRPRAFGSFRK